MKFASLRNRNGAFFMLLFSHKGDDFLRDIYLHPNKYTDSYDNECFAPQFWEDEECIVITTLTPLKTNV